MGMKVVDEEYLESVSSLFRGEKGNRRARLFMKMFSVDKVNWVYDRSGCYSGARFAYSLLNDLGVKYIIGNAERLAQLPEGAFVTISNHPYGGLDGVMLIDLMAGIRQDYKLMVNKMLSLVKTMAENFISVTPTGNKKTGITSESIHGVRETLSRLKEGHPVGFFPSGAVSDLSIKEMRIRDRKWQTSILHLIRSAKVPILPIRFFDTNSKFFYFLGLIDWRIRALRQPAELFNKRGQKHRIGIGKIITVEEQEHYNDLGSFSAFLRKTIYEMPLPQTFISWSRLI
jgi:putative hemolysin